MLSVVILMLLLGAGGFSIKAIWRKATLPEWANLSVHHHWNVDFLNRRLWLKHLLMKLFKFIVIIGVFISHIYKEAIKVSKKLVLPKKS